MSESNPRTLDINESVCDLLRVVFLLTCWLPCRRVSCIVSNYWSAVVLDPRMFGILLLVHFNPSYKFCPDPVLLTASTSVELWWLKMQMTPWLFGFLPSHVQTRLDRLSASGCSTRMHMQSLSDNDLLFRFWETSCGCYINSTTAYERAQVRACKWPIAQHQRLLPAFLTCFTRCFRLLVYYISRTKALGRGTSLVTPPTVILSAEMGAVVNVLCKLMIPSAIIILYPLWVAEA